MGKNLTRRDAVVCMNDSTSRKGNLTYPYIKANIPRRYTVKGVLSVAKL